MKKNFSLYVILSIIACFFTYAKSCDSKKHVTDPTSLVHPNIGSVHSRWFFYTPGAVPFGMAKPGPSTNGSYGNVEGWEAVGYDDRHTSIEGFPCFREFQIGGVMIMPSVGELQTTPGTLENPDSGYRSRFNKEDEIADPGYYRVLLKDYEVEAELTATKRVCFQKYTFPESDSSYIIFDIGNQLGESGKVVDAQISFTDEKHISGFVITEPEYVNRYQAGARVKMCFFAEIDTKPAGYGAFNEKNIQDNHLSSNGKGAGLYLKFNTDHNQSIELKIGLSYTSVDNARLNLMNEARNLDFNEAKKHAKKTWQDELSKIRIEGGTKDATIKFYTGLYHALLGRGIANDVNGAYPRNDGSVGMIPLDEDGNVEYNFYNTDALWGTYWNLTQLWSIGWRDYLNDLIRTHLTVYQDAGWLGDGLATSKYVSGVGTNMVGLVISAAYLRGIRDYDVELAYQAALKNEITWEGRIPGAGKTDLKPFIKKGYIPYIDSWANTEEGSNFSVSHALEYSFSSYAVAQFAKSLGKNKDYEKLMDLSSQWKAYFDSQVKLMRPLDKDGKFIEDFDPMAPWIGFQEGNAFQYTFYVPHQPLDLINLIGRDVFNARLDSIFTISKETHFAGGHQIDAFSGLNNLYNHGNQPGLHISWLFNFSGKPWLTQKWTREIMQTFYGTEGMLGYGIGQDEDQGQLGAWYVMSSMGLFDVGGLTNPDAKMQIGSPVFDKISIKLDPGLNAAKPYLHIITRNNKNEHPYVQTCSFNDTLIESSFIGFDKLMNGGTLHFKMGEKPNYEWGGL